ncbi:MAG: hydroxylamine oxidoreductase [Planctomycetes bacterium]|nr:hydroxylamine oxidoreductase [Planctomycetota bacterium]
MHYDFLMSNIVTPRDCSRCHDREVAEFSASRHALAGDVEDSLQQVLADVVEGSRAFKTAGFPDGVSAAAVAGCAQCHGSQIKLLEGAVPDPATWPNTGVGRRNPDGTRGACHACHATHMFSVAQARHPDTCGKCHLGPDHPQKEIYEESKHGIAFFALEDLVRLDAPRWVVGEDYFTGPTCASCHLSATPNQDVTHDPGLRISWNNRVTVAERADLADERLGLASMDITWEERRMSMKDVCGSCHSERLTDHFFVQYDGVIELYNGKFARPGQELMDLAEPLLADGAPFARRLDWTWYELAQHAGRRARHGAAMAGPDYTHWHGLYDVARVFYNDLTPALDALAARALSSGDSQQVEGGRKLKQRLEEVMQSADHAWQLGGADAEERARREEARRKFEERWGR